MWRIEILWLKWKTQFRHGVNIHPEWSALSTDVNTLISALKEVRSDHKWSEETHSGGEQVWREELSLCPLGIGPLRTEVDTRSEQSLSYPVILSVSPFTSSSSCSSSSSSCSAGSCCLCVWLCSSPNNISSGTWDSIYNATLTRGELTNSLNPSTVYIYALLFIPLLTSAFSTQERGGEVRGVLPEVCGANPAERGAGGQTFTDGDRLHPAEEPLPPFSAVQHPGALHQQHLSGSWQLQTCPVCYCLTGTDWDTSSPSSCRVLLWTKHPKSEGESDASTGHRG